MYIHVLYTRGSGTKKGTNFHRAVIMGERGNTRIFLFPSPFPTRCASSLFPCTLVASRNSYRLCFHFLASTPARLTTHFNNTLDRSVSLNSLSLSLPAILASSPRFPSIRLYSPRMRNKRKQNLTRIRRLDQLGCETFLLLFHRCELSRQR